VARTSAGALTNLRKRKEDARGIGSGAIAGPTVGREAALASVFGVPASYLVERDEDPSVLDKEVLATLADETANAVLRESARLPEREKRIVLGIAREHADQHDAEDVR
jgi:hypothetical protein